MKKLIAILLSIIVIFVCAFSLSACSSSDNTGDTGQNVETTDSSARECDYTQVLEEYKEAFGLAQSGNSDYDSVTNTMKFVPETFVQGVSNYIMMNNDSVDLQMQYAETDLNGDGTQELIVGCKDEALDEPVIDSIFVAGKDGKAQRIISCDSFMYRATIAIYDDGTIEYSGSGGADAHTYDFYKLNSDNTELDLVIDLEENGGSYTNNGEEMSEDDFRNLVKEKEENIEMKLSWKDAW